MNRRRWAGLLLIGALACEDDPPGGLVTPDGGGVSDALFTSDGAPLFTNDGAPRFTQDGQPRFTRDGAFTFSSDGEPLFTPDGEPRFTPDGEVIGDGGDPLTDPLTRFCAGSGTVVEFGTGSTCAGTLAEQTFQFALCACDTMTVGSNLEVDAFDSKDGPYGTGPILDDGHVGINGALGLDKKATVRGSMYVSGGGVTLGPESLVAINLYAKGDALQDRSSSTVGADAYIDGNVDGVFHIGGDLWTPATATVSRSTTVGGKRVKAPIKPVTPCPCESDQILDVLALTAWAKDHNDNAATKVLTSTVWATGGGPSSLDLPCGRYYLTRVDRAGLSIRALGRVVLFVDGDFLIDGNLSMDLAPGAEFNLFVSGNLYIKASAVLGDADIPSAARVYVGGENTINPEASFLLGGNLYAPRAAVQFKASAKLYGALFAKTIVFGGSANVHFDSAIRRAGDACENPPKPTDGGVPSDATIADATSTDATSTDGNVADATSTDGSVADATPAPDASSPDATVGRDGGPDLGDPCSRCGDCGRDLACVIPANATFGQCGACESDLDCCAPNICVAGSCVPSL